MIAAVSHKFKQIIAFEASYPALRSSRTSSSIPAREPARERMEVWDWETLPARES
jgi:hypothetical protein